MFIVDFSTRTIRYIYFKKSLLGKFEINDCGIVDRESSNWEEDLQKIIKGQKIALVIPESVSKIVRFNASSMNKDELQKEVEKNVAEGANIDNIAFDCGIKKKDNGESDVLCLSAHYSDIAPIFSLVQKIDAKPTLAVPESLSIFRILREGIIEGEIILLVDLEEDETHFVFYDATGPIEKSSQQTDLKKLDKTTTSIIEEFIQKNGREVNRIVLSGGLSPQVEPFEFRKSVNILTIKAEDILKDRLSKLNLRFECGGENVGLYINAIGTGLITQEASSLNLVKNDVLMNVEKYAMATKDNIEEKDEQEDSSQKEETIGESSGSKRPRLMAEQVDEKVEEKIDSSPKLKEESIEKKSMSHTIGSPNSQFRSSFRSDESDVEKGRGGTGKKILLFLLIALVVAVIAGVILYFLGGDVTAPQEPETTVIEEPSATPTPTPELERGDIELQVLNGSGEAGLAGNVAAALEDLGYQEGIDTGNADTYDFEETVVRLKEDYADYFEMIKEDLEDEGYVVADDYEELDEDADTDGVVIVGTLNEDQAEDETSSSEESASEDVSPTPEE